jgi:ABC-2 type transport system ATP-binding protein
MPAASTPPAVAPAIELRGLVKDFAVGLRGSSSVRLTISICASLPAKFTDSSGPNGSGKSTSIEIMLGLVEATQGSATIFGIPSSRIEARREVGYLPEAPNFYRYLTGRELVDFDGRACGMRGPGLAGRVAEVIDLVGLNEAADRRVGTYSKGMLQRIGLAQALVHNPRLLILDEPTAGVDPVGTAEISALILRLRAQGKTVLITSHLLGQIEEICDRVAILNHGRLLLEGAVRISSGDRIGSRWSSKK